MRKTTLLFQTTELSETGHKILVSNDNSMSEQDIISDFQKLEEIPSLNGIRLGKNMFGFEKNSEQVETNRKSTSVLLIMNPNICRLGQKQVDELIKLANQFYSEKIPLLKQEAEKYSDEKYQNVVKSKIISDSEKELIEHIPELDKVFVNTSNKKIIISSCVAVALLLVIGLYFFITQKKAFSKDTTELLHQQLNADDSQMINNPEEQYVQVPSSHIANSEIPNSHLTEVKQINDLTVSKDVKENKPRENDFARLHFPKNINPFPSRSKKKQNNKDQQDQLDFMNDYCIRYGFDRNTLELLLQNNTQWKDLTELKPYEINELKNFINNPENILFIGMDEKHKQHLMKFLSIKCDTINSDYVLKCKSVLSDFYDSWLEIYNNQQTLLDYSNMYNSFFNNERLDFVCYITNVEAVKLDNNETLPIFTEDDYKKAVLFEQLMFGKESIAFKFLKGNLMSELSIRSSIANVYKISDFMSIYNSKLLRLIDTKLSLKNIEDRLIGDFDNWQSERMDKFNSFQNLKENRSLDFNTKIHSFVKKLITDKSDSIGLEEKLHLINEQYSVLLNKIQAFGELK